MTQECLLDVVLAHVMKLNSSDADSKSQAFHGVHRGHETTRRGS